MNFKEYADKVRACWLGKNIGGTLGCPLEGRRDVFDLDFYVHDIRTGSLPNDDLDLQLVWLLAAEAHGQAVNSEILSEFWLTYIPCDWSEYGAGKNNMRFGLIPPVTGSHKNPYRNSNGCFIRSEIWACLAPGNPQMAVKYAFEDAITDHADEGVYGELFCATMQSAAFALPTNSACTGDDIMTLIRTGLAFIPEDCRTAQCVRLAIDYYQSGRTWQEARKAILKLAPSTFGLRYVYDNELPDKRPEPDIPMGETGYDAPSNIGIVAIGLLWGEGDFTRSLCTAANCGEDTDCTAGTIGALLGIICGCDGIEKKWTDPIGDTIKTATLDLTKGGIPGTVTDLTQRVTRLMPTFMHAYIRFDDDGVLCIDPPCIPVEQLTRVKCGLFEYADMRQQLTTSPLTIRRSNALFDVGVSFTDIGIRAGEPKNLTVSFSNRLFSQQWAKLTWHLPEGWTVTGGTESYVCVDQYTGKTCLAEQSFEIRTDVLNRQRYDLVLEIASQGRPSRLFIPLVFMQE